MKNLMHYITPILVTVAIFMLTQIGGRMDKIELNIERLAIHFTNHLSGHKDFEVMLGERLTRIETVLGLKK